MHPVNWTSPLPETVDSLTEGDIHIWRFDLNTVLSANNQLILSNSETQHLSNIKHAKHARQYANTRVHLRQILSRYLDNSATGLEFSVALGGKPQLKNAELQFNLSHSHGLGLLAIHRSNPIGIDLERQRPTPQLHKIARRLFPEHICAQLSQGSTAQQQVAFFREWTAMEARQKSQGHGIFSTAVDPLELHCLHFIPANGYIAAVATGKTDTPASIRFITSG